MQPPPRSGIPRHEGPVPARAESEHQDRGTGLGQRGHRLAGRAALAGVQALEAADVKEEGEASEIGRGQVRDVSDDVGDVLRSPAARGRDRGRDVVDTHGFPSAPRELGGELAASAAEIQGPSERAVPIVLFPEQVTAARAGPLDGVFCQQYDDATRRNVRRCGSITF